MSEEKTVEATETEVKKDDFVLTDELRKKATEKPKFNILYVGDDDTRLAPFRGETILKTFTSFYERQADIEFYTVSSSKFAKFKVSDFDDINILWIDNLSDFKSAKNLADLQEQMLEKISPNWLNTFTEMLKTDKDGAPKFAADIIKKRQEKLRIIYALDEFIWEAPVGRSRDIQTVQLMESFMSIADSIIVPTPELKEAISYYGFIKDPMKEIYVIPSTVNVDFFPLFKNFTRTGQISMSLKEKPKVLIKGLALPANIEEFIIDNYKKMQITICSVDEVNEHILGLLSRKKVNHIYHWANPFVNKKNLMATYAIERDSGFDFVIHTKPDNLKGDMYELTLGDEDILFSISYGAIPICGIEHLGYEDDVQMLAKASGLTFGKDTPAKKIAGIIERYQSTPVLFNEAFNKSRQQVENRIATSPFVISRYFSVMLGKELSKARNALMKEKQQEKQTQELIKAKESIGKEPEQIVPPESPPQADVKPDNIIEVDFAKKTEGKE